ncbi:hypothetical protein ACVYZQ_004886 [Raoultella ornithinolytica]
MAADELNPPLGTTMPEIFMDNVKRADQLVNGPADTVPDRGGEPLDTWRQMMAKNDEVRQNIIPLGKQYTTLQEAQDDIANIPEGSSTYYRSPDDLRLAIEIMNVGGTLEPTGRVMVSKEYTDTEVGKVKELIHEKNTARSYLDLQDDDGLIGLSVLDEGDGVGIQTEGMKLSPGELSNTAASIKKSNSGSFFSVEDDDGLSLIAAGVKGAFIGGLDIPLQSEESSVLSRSGNSTFSFIDSDRHYIEVIDDDGLIGGIIYLDDENKTESDSLSVELATIGLNMFSVSVRYGQTFANVLAKPVKKINIIIVFGQSLALGVESRTVLSTAISQALTPGNLMLGQAVRGMNFVAGTGTDFSPVGGASTLHPLQEKLQYVTGELAPEGGGGSTTLGETVMTGLLTTLKHAHNERMGIDGDDPDHLFAGFCVGNSGTPIEQLMKGAPQNYYNRYLTGLQGIKDAADAQGYSVNLVATVFMQGEANYISTSYAAYKSSLSTLMQDLNNDGKAITGQMNDVLQVIYQTGGQYTRDKDNVDIGRAQIDYVVETKNARFCGPYAPLPTPTTTTHLLANSYRWYGCNIAKCIDKALQGAGKVTFRMVGAVYKNDEVYPYFEVPVPPIQLQPAYVVSTPTMIPGRGFTITDSIGSLSGASLGVEVYSPHILKIKCPRELVGPVRVTLGDKSNYNGKHNVCDSDTSEAVFPWEYTGTNGQPANENIPELNDKNYVLRNWAAAYSLIAEKFEE